MFRLRWGPGPCIFSFLGAMDPEIVFLPIRRHRMTTGDV